MIMNKRILSILSALCLVAFVACTNEDDPIASSQKGEVCFSVIDTVRVEVETKATHLFDVNEFNMALSHNGEPIFSSRKFKEISGTPLSCYAGTGYVVTAESCTEREAERANSGWGQIRVAGKAEFEVKAEETKDVEIVCSQANSSVNAGFSDFVRKTFEDYSITFYAADAESRTILFDQNNYSLNKTAYFNVEEGGRALQYTVSLTLPGAKKPYVYTGSQTLEPASNYKLTVTMKDESQLKLSIQITNVDGTLLKEETLTEAINPYK